MDINKSFFLLCTVNYFQKLSFDESGLLFDQTLAFYSILGDKNSVGLFVELFAVSKTNEGKLYALVGLFLTDKGIYFLKKKEISNFKVTTFIADTDDIENVLDVLDDLEEGELQKLLFWNTTG
jgi:hypothetical protein